MALRSKRSRRSKRARQIQRSIHAAEVAAFLSAAGTSLAAALLNNATFNGYVMATLCNRRVTKMTLHLDLIEISLDGSTLGPVPDAPAPAAPTPAPSPVDSMLVAIGECVARLMAKSHIRHGEVILEIKGSQVRRWRIVHVVNPDECDEAGWTLYGE